MENNQMPNQPPKKKGNLVLWILGWLFLFPITATYFIWRKQNLWRKSAKITATVILWLFVFIISGINGKKDTANETATETTKVEAAAQTETTKAAETTTVAPTEETTEATTEESKEEYDSQFKNDFVALVKEFDAEIFSDWDVTASNDGPGMLTAGVLIENNEDVVNSFFDKLKELINNSEECDSAIITVGDKAKGADSEALFLATIENGEMTTSMESMSYNSAHNMWVRDQFSAWDGSHREMTKLIKKNLNDEEIGRAHV